MATFVARSRATIRDTILTNWQARYRTIGLDLLIIRGSDAYMQADTFALELEGIEAQAAQNRKDILPDKAGPEALARHGFVDGVLKEPATYARFTLTGTCTAFATLTTNGKTVQSSGGLRFLADGASVTDLDGDGVYTIAVTATTLGAKGNLPVGAVVQWSQTPVGATSAALTVTAVTTTATDEESDADYALRIILRRQERPGSGNRADWVNWAGACDGVLDAYAFPGFNWALGAAAGFVLGSLTVMPMGPRQGRSATDTRTLSPTRLDEIKDYIEGLRDKAGTAITNGRQLRPAIIAPGNYTVTSPPTVNQTVWIEVTLAPGFKNEEVSTHARMSGTTAYVEVSGTAALAYVGQAVRVYVTTMNTRGGYALRRVESVVTDGFNTELHFDTVLPNVASNDAYGLCIYPSPGNDQEIMDAVFGYFDELGPSAFDADFERYPPETFSGGSTLYLTNFMDAIIPTFSTRRELINGVEGVISAIPADPSSNIDVPTGSRIVLTTLRITQV
jgi:hypothetical protein